MTKEQVIKRFCKLSNQVMNEVFHFKIPADCFCSENPLNDFDFQFSEGIVKFIELAVSQEIERVKRGES
jgi:hypothetical protein